MLTPLLPRRPTTERIRFCADLCSRWKTRGAAPQLRREVHVQEAHGPPTQAGCNVAAPRTPHAHGRAGARTRAHTHTHTRGACERSLSTWSRSSAQACVRARRTPSHACSARWPRTCVGVWVQAAAPTPLLGAVPGSTGGAVTPTWPRRRHDGTNVKWAAKVHTWSASVHKTTSA